MMSSDALAAGKAFAERVGADPQFRAAWEAVQHKLFQIADEFSGSAFKAECEHADAVWEAQYGIPCPRSEEELQRWMIRVGGTPGQYLDSSPAEIVSFVEGYLLRQRDGHGMQEVEKSGSEQGDGYLDVNDLAKRFGVPAGKVDALRSRLKRWMQANAASNDYTEVEGAAQNRPKYLYRASAVKKLCEGLAAK